jgi:hypothetical protein
VNEEPFLGDKLKSLEEMEDDFQKEIETQYTDEKRRQAAQPLYLKRYE